MFKKILKTALAMAAAVASKTTLAATITFYFTGTVTSGGPMAVVPGTKISGTYSYDDQTAPGIANKGYADYVIPAPHRMNAVVGGHVITTGGGLNVSIWNHYKGNVEDMIWITGGGVVLDGTTFSNGLLGFTLASAPRNNRALNGTKLPQSLDVTRFNAGSGLNYGVLQIDGGPEGMLLQFSIDSVIAVPAAP